MRSLRRRNFIFGSVHRCGYFACTCIRAFGPPPYRQISSKLRDRIISTISIIESHASLRILLLAWESNCGAASITKDHFVRLASLDDEKFKSSAIPRAGGI